MIDSQVSESSSYKTLFLQCKFVWLVQCVFYEVYCYSEMVFNHHVVFFKRSFGSGLCFIQHLHYNSTVLISKFQNMSDVYYTCSLLIINFCFDYVRFLDFYFVTIHICYFEKIQNSLEVYFSSKKSAISHNRISMA